MEFVQLHSTHDTLIFECATGKLLSFRSDFAPEQEFISSSAEHPAFILQYIDADGQYLQLVSQQAETVEVLGETTRLTATYARLAGLALQVTFTVTAQPDDRFTRWTITVDNQAGLCIADVQFPFIIAAYQLGGCGRESLPCRTFQRGCIALESTAGYAAGGHPIRLAIPPRPGRQHALSRRNFRAIPGVLQRERRPLSRLSGHRGQCEKAHAGALRSGYPPGRGACR